MIVYELNPLTDARWPNFVTRHSRASVFHSVGWLQALHSSYGYDSVVFTTSGPNQELSDGVVFSKINSWLTGSRLVSLPFSDHCQPLANGAELEILLQAVQEGSSRGTYVELRPRWDELSESVRSHFGKSEEFSFHTIDLRPDSGQIYRRFHDSCIRRKIKRAEREGLTYESGRSDRLLQQFRQLLLLTRRRHKLAPQPLHWFQNVLRCLGERATIHMLSKGLDPVASIITLQHCSSLVYKYGVSDERFHALGSMPFLFWKVIQQAKEMGVDELDLGRSARKDPGLIAFKEHLGGTPIALHYYRCPAPVARRRVSVGVLEWGRKAVGWMPQPVLNGAGELLYRHLG